MAEIWSMTAVVNEPSQAVMRRLGMILHSHFDHPSLQVGHSFRLHVVYRLQGHYLAQRHLPSPDLATAPARYDRPQPGFHAARRSPT
jgi:hypothetical protein